MGLSLSPVGVFSRNGSLSALSSGSSISGGSKIWEILLGDGLRIREIGGDFLSLNIRQSRGYFMDL